jgi:hypothetical protein
MKRLQFLSGQTFESFRQCSNPSQLPREKELATRWRGSDTNRSAVTRRTDALHQFSLHQSFDNPAHGRRANLFYSRQLTNGFLAVKYQNRKGGELRGPDTRVSIFCPDQSKQPDGPGMQSISHGDLQRNFT